MPLIKNDRDKVLVCSNCGETFLFEYWQQKFYKQKGLEAPKKCADCRKGIKKISKIEAGSGE